MNNIKAILFDLDNTIVDRTQAFRAFVDRLLAAFFPHPDDTREIADRIMELDEDGYKDKRVLFAELIGELPWQEKPDVAELLDFYYAHYVDCAVLLDGAREVLVHLRKSYIIGLITNGQTSTQYGKLDRLGIRGAFDVACQPLCCRKAKATWRFRSGRGRRWPGSFFIAAR